MVCHRTGTLSPISSQNVYVYWWVLFCAGFTTIQASHRSVVEHIKGGTEIFIQNEMVFALHFFLCVHKFRYSFTLSCVVMFASGERDFTLDNKWWRKIIDSTKENQNVNHQQLPHGKSWNILDSLALVGKFLYVKFEWNYLRRIYHPCYFRPSWNQNWKLYT